MSTSYDQVCQAIADAGSQRKAARRLGISLGKLQRTLYKGPAPAREPVFEPRGRVEVKNTAALELPPTGMINRYLLTCAQNDTAICEPVWNSLHALMTHWAVADPRVHDVRLMVSRFAYRNFQSEDKAQWSTTGRTPAGTRLMWDPRLSPYLVDHRLRLANKLVWCGEMNLSPTAMRPMASLESYNGSSSAVFPHTRLVMRAEPSVGFEGAKLLHTTGAVTVRNYIQRKAGLQAEFHHCYGAALVEVDHRGHFWVRQLNAAEDGTIYDLDLRATPDRVSVGHRPAAIYLPDLHPEELDEANFACALGMIRALQPRSAFIGDVLTHRLSHWNRGDHLKRFALHAAGDHNLLKGIAACHAALERLERALGVGAPLSICRSNHDDHLLRWLTEEEGFRDPTNARLWHLMNVALMDEIKRQGGREDWINTVNPVMFALELFRPSHGDSARRWLGVDQVADIAGVNHGAHGHAGPRGSRGSPWQFAKLGMKANYGHVHAPGIYDGAYFAGTFGRHLYYKGPSPSACASILTHENGKRQIVANWRNQWRA